MINAIAEETSVPINERQRTEFFRHRIPGGRSEEMKTEFFDGQ